MKKIVLIAVVILTSIAGYSQSIDDIREALGSKEIDYAKAKELVDKHLANPKNAAKPEGWYYKGYIYNAISKKDNLSSLCEDCKLDAFNAFKKYQELDKKNILMAIEQNSYLFDLYNGFNEVAVKAYTDKNFALSLKQFKNALEVEDYVRSKDFDYRGYKYPAIDTLLISYIGLAARADNKPEEALKYYKILSDADIAGTENQEIYQFIARHYSEAKDATNFAAAIAKGKKLYPNDPYWSGLETDFALAGAANKEEMFTKYEELVQKSPNDYDLAFRYSLELYKYLSDSKVKIDKATRASYNDKLVKALKNTIAIKSTGEANLQMAVYLYNNSYDLSDEAKLITSTKPDELKKRKALNDAAAKSMNESIVYCEITNKYYAGLPKLESIDKANYKNSLRMLQNIYEAKNNPAKAAEYENISKALDAK